MASCRREKSAPASSDEHNNNTLSASTGDVARLPRRSNGPVATPSRKRKASMDGGCLAASGTPRETSFLEVFAPLAHHFFPDGSPNIEVFRHCEVSSYGDESDTEDEESGVFAVSRREALWLSQCWPKLQNRNPVTPQQAKNALNHLRFHVRGGEETKRARPLTAGQILALAVVARASLPTCRTVASVGEGSRLVDGTCRILVQLLRCMIPCEQVPSSVVYMLLSLATTTTYSYCDFQAQSSIFRFFTLCIRHAFITLDRPNNKPQQRKPHAPDNNPRKFDSAQDIASDNEKRRKRRRTDSTLPLEQEALGNDPSPSPKTEQSDKKDTAGDANPSYDEDCHDTDDSWIVHSEVLYSAVLSAMMRLSVAARGDVQAYTVIGDATRLLYVMTRRRHVNAFRAQLLHQMCCQHAEAAVEEPPTKQPTQSRDASTVTLESPLQGSSSSSAEKRSNSRGRRALQLEHNRTILSLLLQLFARYNPRGCTKFLPPGPRILHSSRKDDGILQHLRVPDRGWEEDFGRSKSRLEDHVMCDRKSTTSERYHATNESFSRDLVEWLEEACVPDAGIRRTFWDLLLEQHSSETGTKTARASAWLRNEALKHWIMLSFPANAQDGDEELEAELIRFRSCLAFMIHEEWYLADMITDGDIREEDEGSSSGDDDDDDDGVGLGGSSYYYEGEDGFHSAQTESGQVSKGTQTAAGRKIHRRRLQRKLRLLDSIASFAEHSDVVLPEIEAFLLEVVLPLWDGGDGPITETLCHRGLLRMLRPSTFPVLERKLLKPLAERFMFASPQVKYSIVTGILAPLLSRWGRIPFSSSVGSKAMGTEAERRKEEKLKMWRATLPLIRWTDNLILSGLVVDSRIHGGEHELVRVSALDFYNAVCDLASKELSLSLFPVVPFPSPALVYQLLLSNTAVSVDRLCGLLLRYKELLEEATRQRQRQEEGKDDESSNESSVSTSEADLEDVTHEERIKLFNCYVFDLCNVLWRCAPLPGVEDDGGSDEVARSHSILFTDLRQDTLKALHQVPVEFNVASFLSITQGSVFGGHASDFLSSYDFQNGNDTVDEDRKPLSPSMLQGAVKMEYLDHLRDNCNYRDLHRFLSTFVSSLIERERQRETIRTARSL